MNKYSIPALVAISLAWGAAGAAEEADDSGLTYEDKLASCAACHGENGDKPLAPDYPMLAGQHQDYLESALQAYRSGRRQHPIMNMQVETLGLTDRDIERLAAHFASKEGLTSVGE
ncbi:MAG: c-type cytochrome [Gammaproteobacteria bacterium]